MRMPCLIRACARRGARAAAFDCICEWLWRESSPMSLHCHASSAQSACPHLQLKFRPAARRIVGASVRAEARQCRSKPRLPCRGDLGESIGPAAEASTSYSKSDCEVSRPGRLEQLYQRLSTETSLYLIAALAAAISLSQPAWAEIQTVPSSQATQYAKPIQKQKTDKGFVAVLFAAGAASLFGSAVLLERNSKLFPAIYKANQVMRAAEQRNKGRAIAEQAVTDLEEQDDTRLQRSVEAGLANARARVLPESSDSMASTSSTSGNASTSSGTSTSADAHSPTASSSPSKVKHADKGANSNSEIPYHDKNKDQASSSPDRSKGSQLSDQEKQEAAAKSFTGS